MYGLNKAQIIGRLGGDPELKTTQAGNAVCSFSVATNENYKDQNGTLIERTEWHRCVAWGRLAEIIAEYLKKGSLAFFEGKLQTRKWQDKDGADRWSTEIMVQDMLMLGDKRDHAEQGREEFPAHAANKDVGKDDLPF
jgi:single-strand DNA-binding protein